MDRFAYIFGFMAPSDVLFPRSDGANLHQEHIQLVILLLDLSQLFCMHQIPSGLFFIWKKINYLYNFVIIKFHCLIGVHYNSEPFFLFYLSHSLSHPHNIMGSNVYHIYQYESEEKP